MRQSRVEGLRAQLDAGHVAEVGDRPAAVGLQDDVRELLGVGEPALGDDGVLEVLAARHGRPAELPGRHLDVLLAQGGDDVPGGHVARGELVGIDPDAHAVVLLAQQGDVADALRRGPARPGPGWWRSC